MSAAHFEIIDRAISLKAAAISDCTGADLFLHSGYAAWAFDGRGNRRRWLYQYHPHARSVQEILARDADRYPEIRHSFETEADSQPQKTSTDVLSEWMKADEIFCASTFTAQSLVMQGCPRERMHVIPYGCDIAPVRLADESLRGPCHFLFVGQGVQRKGLHHLLRAWRAADLRDSRLTVVARRLDPGLRTLLDFSSIEHLVDISAVDLQRLMSISDVFVMPSLVEGFGLVFLEALSNGLFCIGTPNTGLLDLNLPLSSGLTTPVGDVPQLQKVLEDAAAMKRKGLLSKAAIQAVAKTWSWDRHRSTLRNAIGGADRSCRAARRDRHLT